MSTRTIIKKNGNGTVTKDVILPSGNHYITTVKDVKKPSLKALQAKRKARLEHANINDNEVLSEKDIQSALTNKE